jgi:hypothetical protein
MVDKDFYYNTLYPFQDRMLSLINTIDTGFYLTGGTAASRAYLHHRFSDDLDFFVNDDPNFGLWVDRIIQSLLKRGGWKCDVLVKEERYARLNVIQTDLALKIELINDVPARVGQVEEHPVLGRLDTAQNILANKVTALLVRDEPKDLADIWGFCTLMDLPLEEAISNAESKAAGVFPPDLARLLITASEHDWSVVRWIEPPPVQDFLNQLKTLGENLLLLK